MLRHSAIQNKTKNCKENKNSLYSILNNEEYLFGDALELLEEFRRSVIVTSLGLDRFDDDAGHKFAGLVEPFEKLFDLGQAFAILGFVLLHVLFQRILIAGETGDRPIQCRNVQLVNGFRVSGGQHADCPTVKSACRLLTNKIDE